MDINTIVFSIIILFGSAIIHEYMHGWAAFKLGDTTAKDMGRLTLNPISHIDPFGSILLPALLAISGAPVFGYAKPVPYNPYNLNDAKYGGAKVAIAGPSANLVLALIFGSIIRFNPGFLNEATIQLFALIVIINIVLMVFNLLPIPPLDGSKVITPFLPANIQEKYIMLEQYGLLIVFALVFLVGFSFLWPIIGFFFYLLTGFKLF